MRLPRAMLFDLDNTLLDTDNSGDLAWETVCREAAPDLELTTETLLEAVRKERDWFWSDYERARAGALGLPDSRKIFIARALATLRIQSDDTAGRIATRFAELRRLRNRLFPDAIATLEVLREHGIALGLITNGSGIEQRQKVEDFDLGSFFAHINIEGETGLGKPDERVFLDALDALGVDAESAWMVGDWLELDVLPAQKLGLTGIWIDRLGRGLPAGISGCRVIRSLRELLIGRPADLQ